MTKRKAISRIGIFQSILVLLIVLGAARASAAFKYAFVGTEAREISGQDVVTGSQISTSDLHRDNMVIVVFWATWSPRSLEQLADMDALKLEYADHPVEIVAVNVDAPEISSLDRTEIKAKIEEMGLTIPVIIDDGLEIFYSYGVIAVPSTAIIDTSGTIRYDPSGYGMLTRDRIVDSVKAFLGMTPAGASDILKTGYTPLKKSARYYNLALQLKQNGMFDRALENLDLAHQADTLFPAPLSMKGEILLLQGKSKEAQSVLAQAAALDSSSVVIWAGWGRSLLQAGQTDAAREKLVYALSLDDTFTPALIDFGLCLAEQDSLAAAIDSLTRAAELNRGDPMIPYYLGRVYRRAGQLGKAAVAYMKALAIIYAEN